RHAHGLELLQCLRSVDPFEMRGGHRGALAGRVRKMERGVLMVVVMSLWTALGVVRDHDPLALLHLAAQMLGKLRVAHAPWTNQGWTVEVQPDARGFSHYHTAT